MANGQNNEDFNLKVYGELLNAVKQLENSHNPKKSKQQVIQEAISLYYQAYTYYKEGYDDIYITCSDENGQSKRFIKIPFNNR